MKKILGMIVLGLCLYSCTGGVSDEVKSVAFSKVLMGKSFKLPASSKPKDLEAYKALKSIVHFDFKTNEKQEDGTFKATGTVKVEDANRISGVLMGLMFQGQAKGESTTQAIERTLASVDAKIDATKGYKPKPETINFELHYKNDDGKEVVTKFKKLKK